MDKVSINNLQLKIDQINDDAWNMKYSDIKEMLKLSIEAYDLSEKISYHIGKGRSLLLIGTYYYYVGDISKSLLNLNQALLFIKNFNDVWSARTLNALGNYYSLISSYETALQYYMQGISILNKEHDIKTYLTLLNNISDLYHRIGNYEQATRFIKKFIDYAEKNSVDMLHIGLVTLSEINISSKNYSEALDQSYRALKILEQNKDIHWIGICYTNLGSAYLGLNKLEDSYNYLIKAHKIYESRREIQPLAIINIRLGEYFIKKALYDKALTQLVNTVNMAENSNLKKEMIEAYFLLADVCNALENTEKEVFYYRKAVELEKEHSSKIIEDKLNTVTLEFKLEESKKDSEIYKLKNIELKQKSEELEKKNLELSETLEKLKQTHEYLIQSEKMASLGLIVAAIASEINSPLGAIQASANNIADYLSQLNRDIPNIFIYLSDEEKALFFTLVSTSFNSDKKLLPSKEARQTKKGLIKTLENNGLKNVNSIADALIDMAIYENIEQFLPLFKSDRNLFILNTAYTLSNLQRNSNNIEIAVNRASKTVYALKNYARSSENQKFLKASVIAGIEIVLTLYNSKLKHTVKVVKNYCDVPEIMCLPDQLNQVWTSLIQNLLSAMNNKGTLTINVYEKNNNVIVEIMNYSSEIPSGIQNSLSEPFFTTKPEDLRLSLGLHISKDIIEKHKGSLIIESIPYKTKFTVILPISNNI